MSCLDMSSLSQIVGELATPFYNSLCVERDLSPWQIVEVEESQEKNGGPNYLRAWRQKRKLTQEQLASKVGTSANMIQYLESGERGLSVKWLRRLAPALGTTDGNLLLDPEAMNMEAHDYFAGGKLSPEQQRQLIAIAEALVKTGTDQL